MIYICFLIDLNVLEGGGSEVISLSFHFKNLCQTFFGHDARASSSNHNVLFNVNTYIMTNIRNLALAIGKVCILQMIQVLT